MMLIMKVFINNSREIGLDNTPFEDLQGEIISYHDSNNNKMILITYNAISIAPRVNQDIESLIIRE